MKRKIIAMMAAVSMMMQGISGIAAEEQAELLVLEKPDESSEKIISEAEQDEINLDAETEGISESAEEGTEPGTAESEEMLIESVEVLDDAEYVPEQAAVGDVVIDEVNFPDEGFRNYIDRFDNNKDGVLSAEEIEKIEDISPSDRKIQSLKGIEYFTSLTWLDCAVNQLSSLDISHNPNLETLECFSNQLSSLDVSHNPALKVLLCENNQLSSLDVSHNPALEQLRCDGNPLGNLDTSHNPALKSLKCERNRLSSLDVRQNLVLESLECGNNQLSSLDVSHKPALRTVSCFNNQLGSLDASHNPALVSVVCYSNQLSSLDVSYDPVLTELSCDRNQLVSLDVSHNPALKRLNCYDNQLSSLDISDSLALESLSCYNNRLSSLDARQNSVLGYLDGNSNEGNELHVTAPDKINDVWQLNLANIVGNSNLERVIVTTKGASLSNGIVTFTGSGVPRSLKYKYDTMGPALNDTERLLDVTLKWDIPETLSDGESTTSPNDGSTTKPEENGTDSGDGSTTSQKKQNQTITVKKQITKTYKKNGTFKLDAKANGKLTYKTSNKKVATVSASGVVKMTGCGQAVITVKAAATEKYKAATAKVKLIIKGKQTIIVNETITKTFKQGEKFNLGAKAEGKLTYQINNTKVAVISAAGVVKITGCGTAVITVKAAATEKYKEATAKVKLIVKGKK